MGFCKILCTALFAGVGFVGTPAMLIVAAIMSSKFGDNNYEVSSMRPFTTHHIIVSSGNSAHDFFTRLPNVRLP